MPEFTELTCQAKRPEIALCPLHVNLIKSSLIETSPSNNLNCILDFRDDLTNGMVRDDLNGSWYGT